MTCPSSFQGLPLSGGTLTGPLVVTGHISAAGTAPGMAAGANAGTTPPAPVVGTGSSDGAGNATFGTGTTPAAGAMVAVTFATAYTNTPGISLDPSNAATEPLGLYISAASGSGFTVSAATAPSASQANTTYAFSYVTEGATH